MLGHRILNGNAFGFGLLAVMTPVEAFLILPAFGNAGVDRAALQLKRTAAGGEKEEREESQMAHDNTRRLRTTPSPYTTRANASTAHP
jgi:hypothetical protein